MSKSPNSTVGGKSRVAHYVLSSHWDREWYQTFQDYRARLVRMLDRVVDLLESGELKGPFTCDGQTIILPDYLEVRPEKTARVRELLASGKLVAGPWYVLPDEFLVSGESLVRNLRKGIGMVKGWGAESSRAGFVCDLFGHVSQLPQIFHGFGIRAALVWRGVPFRNDARFLWIGADGSVVPAYRFGKSGYCDYANKVRKANQPTAEFEESEARAALVSFVEKELEATGPSGPALIFDGADHLEPEIEHYRLLWDTELPCPVEHSTLDRFIDDLVASFPEVERGITGELRDTGSSPMSVDEAFLIPGVGSSRQWIKQENADCQTLLCAWAEPLSVLATLQVGAEWPARYLELAWEWLLQNHPHDSICGCSIDEVHEDMKYRFSQSRQIAARLATEARQAIACAISGTVSDREMRVTIFHAGSQSRKGPVDLTLQIPADWPEFSELFGFENQPAFRIYRMDGEEVPYQRISQKRNASRLKVRGLKLPESVAVREVRVAIDIELPACGYTTFLVRGDASTGWEVRYPMVIGATRHPETSPIGVSNHCLENEFLRIEAGSALTIFDKTTGQTYTNLLEFEDCADFGDGWFHYSPVNDRVYSSVGSATDVSLVHNGPLSAALGIRRRMMVPASFLAGPDVRSAEMCELVIDSTVTLRRGERFADVEVRVVNSVRDHCLRALFPSGAKTETFLSDAAFDVVERPIALRSDNYRTREMEVENKPQQSWTAVSDSERGLAIIADGGLLESGVRDTADRPVVLTLFRSTGRTVMTTGQPNGQMLGKELCLRFRILPFAGEPARSEFFRVAQELAAGFETCQVTKNDLGRNPSASGLPPESSLFEIDGPAVVTSCQMVGDAVEIRVFNPCTDAIHARLKPSPLLDPAGAKSVDFLSGVRAKELASGPDAVEFDLLPKEILTLSLPVKTLRNS